MSFKETKTNEKSLIKKYDEIYDSIDGVYEYDEGLLCPPCMPPKVMDDFINEFKFKSDDVVIVSYPRSGTLWLQEVVWFLHNQKALKMDMSKKDNLAHRIPFMDHKFKNEGPKELLDQYPSPRLMKSNLSRKYLEKQMEHVKDDVKIILWTMNPKDVIANYHQYWNEKGRLFNFPNLEWNKCFELFRTKQLFEGDWFDMNKSWTPFMHNDDQKNVLTLNYEHSEGNREDTVREIAKFCGIKVSDWRVQKIAYIVEFDHSPDWTKKFSDEQKKFVNDKYKQEMQGTPLENMYIDA